MNQKHLSEGLFRISAVLYARNNSSNISIKQVIRKIIEDVLFHLEGKKDCYLSNLITLIYEQHKITLSDDEIIKVVRDKKFSDNFIYYYDNEENLKVSLSEKRRLALDHQFKNKNLFDYILEFIKVNELPQSCIEVFNRFFYDVFATNLEGYKRLLNGQSIIEETDTVFNQEEKNIINQFLNWEKPEKNQAIYYLANYAIEYCMLVNKKDSFFDVSNLKNKRLYLDTNILFRAIGIDGEDRKSRTEQFLSKFKHVGQQLYITKETDNEFKNTLIYYTDKLRQSFTPSCKVNPKVYAETVEIDGFYKNYCKWCGNNRIDKSIDNYKRTIMAKYEEVLSRFSIEKDYTYPYSPEDRKKLIDEYTSQILSHSENKLYLAAETDARNIIWIESKRNGENNDLYKVFDYLISSDQSLRRWDYNRNQNDVPVVMLPSQWLSLILRYMERTDNDYKSFVNFLNIKISDRCLAEEQLFSVINGISEITSDIEQQRFLVKSYIKEDFEYSIQNLNNEEIKEKAKSFAKTELEQRIDSLENQQVENQKCISELEDRISDINNTTSAKIEKKDQEISEIKKELDKEKNENKSKDVRIEEFELKDWKRPRYMFCIVGLLLCIVAFVLYFVAQDWNFNYPAKLLNKIDDLSGCRNVIAMSLLCFIHAVLALILINGVVCLRKIKPNDDRKLWLLKLFEKQINK